MPEVTELLERLADRPPCDPTPLADIRARARRRQRRRQRVTVGGLGLCLVIAAVVVVVTSGSNPDDVRTGATTTEPTLAASNGLDISPAADLRDGQEVTLSLPSDPGGEVRVTQCAAEFVGIADDPSANWWCGGVYSLRSPAGPPDLVVRVARRLETPNGTVDCASAPGRCLLYAGAAWPGSRRHTFDTRRVAPLVFADDLGPLPEGVLRLVDVDSPVADGQKVRVEGEGYGAGETVSLAQCVQAEEPETCDIARTTFVQADADGSFALDLLVFHDIAMAEETEYPLDWRRCEPCVVTASAASVPIELAPTADPIRPSLRIVSDGPYTPGQDVGIVGEGFQANTFVGIGWCRAGQEATCMFPFGDFPHADGDGRLDVEPYPLPGGDAPTSGCADVPNTCVLGWGPSQEGAPLGVEIPLDLSG